MVSLEPAAGGDAREVVRVGVIGLGRWGPVLVRNVAELEGVEIAYVCDSRPEILNRVSRRFRGVLCSTDVDAVLRDPSIDAVAIDTPVGSHYARSHSPRSKRESMCSSRSPWRPPPSRPGI